MKQKRTCSICQLPVQKTHRWKTVYHKFLFWSWATIEHRNCAYPELGQQAIKRLRGEVPLPFPSSEEHA